jgi:hypothetical protein
MDHFSPFVPAAIRVLVLPVHIEASRFNKLVARLQKEASVIRLIDLAHDEKDYLLHPKSFPHGRLLYNYSTSEPSQQSSQLSPFELFREPLLILGIVDESHRDAEQPQLENAAQYLREKHPRVVHRQLIVLDDDAERETKKTKSSTISISNLDQDHDRSLWAAMREVSTRFLSDLSTYANALQASPNIQTPGQTSRNYQRFSPLRENDRRPGSSSGTPPQSVGVPSPVDEESPRHSSGSHGPPATSFDQMQGVTGIQRSDSNASNPTGKIKARARATSNDRVPPQGFGSNNSQEKLRARGKARVGIVIGAIQVMAGQWLEGQKALVDHTSKARSLADNLWTAKGLEMIMVCLLLQAWAETEFSIPSLCYPAFEKSGHVSRLSASLSPENKIADDPKERRKSQVSNLSKAIPDLLRAINDLYRSAEGALELPFLAPADAAIRSARLLTVLAEGNGELSLESLKSLATPHMKRPAILGSIRGRSYSSGPRALTRIGISDLLSQALPTDDDGVNIVDHITLLAGLASAYSTLGLERKKAVTVQEMIVRLTSAMVQARKIGAAEMGIHPAASLSMISGQENTVQSGEETRGFNLLMDEISNVYGISLVPDEPSIAPVFAEPNHSGNKMLKHGILRELAAFCEASPDPDGLLRVSASHLRMGGPNSAIDLDAETISSTFSREEQIHLNALIGRTVAVSKHLGLSDSQAAYWDPFIVRDVQFALPTAEQIIIDRSRLNSKETAIDPERPANPLLYDPNASRPGTSIQPKSVLVQGELAKCIVTLQNPFSMAVELEELEVVTDGVQLQTHFKPMSLGPLRFQSLPVLVSSAASGDTKLTAIRLKVHGCYSQVFPILDSPWASHSPLTIKSFKPEAPSASETIAEKDALHRMGIRSKTISATIVGPLPTLTLEHFSRSEFGIMLLDGETQTVTVALRNTGTSPARIFEIKDNQGVIRSAKITDEQVDADEILERIIQPGQTINFKISIIGKAEVTSTRISFYYGPGDPDQTRLARIVSVSVDMTVNAALQIQHFEIISRIDNSSSELCLAFEIRNAWPELMHYQCKDTSQDDKDLSHGQLVPGEVKRICLYPARPDADFESTISEVWAQLLRQLKITWTVEKRSGVVDLNGIPCPTNSMESLLQPPARLAIQIRKKKLGDLEPIDSGSHVQVLVGQFITIQVSITNHFKRLLPLHVQLSPQQDSDIVRDERRFVVAGALQRILPPMTPGAVSMVEFVLCPTLPGTLRLNLAARAARISSDFEQLGDWTSHKSFFLVAGNTPMTIADGDAN